jgi:hypothetical protein
VTPGGSLPNLRAPAGVLDDGRFEVDNNRYYGLIETTKANGCEPYALRRVFTDLPKATTVAEIEALLPWNVARPATLSAAA